MVEKITMREIQPFCSAPGCSNDGASKILGEWLCNFHANPPRQHSHHHHPNSARFHHLLEELGKLHDKKQIDYGKDDDPFFNINASEEWGVAPWIGALLRASDKMRRLQSLARTGELANESAEDSMRDIAVYAIIALVLYEKASEHSL